MEVVECMTEPNLRPLAHVSVKLIYWHQAVAKVSAVLSMGTKQGGQVASAQKAPTPQWLSEEGV